MVRALLAIAVLCCAPAATHAARWHTAETDEFIVIGDAPKRQVSEVLEALEVYRHITSRFAILRKPAPYKPRIFVLRSDSFRRYGRQRKEIAGFVKPSDFEMDIVVDSRDTNDWLSNRQIIQHELTHFYLRLNSRRAMLPVWYDEGFAEFFSTVSFKGKQARIGDVPIIRFYALQQLPWLPLERLLTIDRRAAEYQGHRLGDSFYAQSWLLVHYSFLKDPALAPALERMILAQSLSTGVTDAMRLALGPRAQTLEADMRRYAASSAWPYRYFERPAESLNTAELRDLDDETAAAEIGALLLRLANRSAEDLHADISELLPMARGADAAAVKAMSKLVIDKPAEADPYLQLCEATAQTSRALRHCAQSFMARALDANSEDERSGFQRKAVNLAQRSLQIDPDHFAALHLLLHTRDHVGADVADLFPQSERALEKLPSSFTLRLSLAEAYYNAGRLADAVRHLEQAALDETDPSRRDAAMDRLHFVENVLADREKH
jgi:tetratricopeptide (TPR) repeat protein